MILPETGGELATGRLSVLRRSASGHLPGDRNRSRTSTESEEIHMAKKKLEVKIRKLEKIETTINRGGASG